MLEELSVEDTDVRYSLHLYSGFGRCISHSLGSALILQSEASGERAGHSTREIAISRWLQRRTAPSPPRYLLSARVLQTGASPCSFDLKVQPTDSVSISPHASRTWEFGMWKTRQIILNRSISSRFLRLGAAHARRTD